MSMHREEYMYEEDLFGFEDENLDLATIALYMTSFGFDCLYEDRNMGIFTQNLDRDANIMPVSAGGIAVMLKDGELAASITDFKDQLIVRYLKDDDKSAVLAIKPSTLDLSEYVDLVQGDDKFSNLDKILLVKTFALAVNAEGSFSSAGLYKVIESYQKFYDQLKNRSN